MVHAECLPPEIWLEIFSYLDAHDNVRAFLSLNRFFDQFAWTKYFGIHHIVGTEKSIQKTPTESLRLHTIRSIANGPNVPEHLVEFLRRHANELVQLRKISIFFPKKMLVETTARLADALNQLPSLRSIEIRSNTIEFFHDQMKDFLSTLFNNRLALTHCQLLFSFEHLHLLLDQSSGPSSIQYLTFGKISLSNLFAILSQTPNLISLYASTIGGQCQLSTLILSSLRKISLKIDKMPFSLLMSICRLAPHLENFLVWGSFKIDDEDYFREDLWKQLLSPISFYNISLTNWCSTEDQKRRITRIYASLLQNDWLKMFVYTYETRVTISFRSTSTSFVKRR